MISRTYTPPTSPKLSDEKEYERIKTILQDKQNKNFQVTHIIKNLYEKDTMRKTFLAVIRNSPARISEISDYALLTKTTCYSQLFKLLDLGIVDRVFVMPIINGSVKNDEIKKKYEIWTNNMPEPLKRYYLAKTSFWVITDFGKRFAVKAYEFENEFRDKSIKDEEENKKSINKKADESK